MVKKEVEFRCPEGMEMKAVALLIQTASTFRSQIWIALGERRANGKSLLGVMSLGLEDGSVAEVTCEGSDEDEALEAILKQLENPNFD